MPTQKKYWFLKKAGYQNAATTQQRGIKARKIKTGKEKMTYKLKAKFGA